MPFSLKLFGGACLEGEDGPLTGPAVQRHRLALLALLAVTHPGGLSREKLLAYLWPERATESARNLLKQAVHALRRALGEGVIRAAGEELRIEPSAVRVDVLAFQQALAEGHFERAVDLYAGPFLDGFFLSDSPEFERWADRERERLAGACARALEALAEGAETRGQLAEAVGWWKAQAARDPYDSRVALRLMQALDASGNRPGAIQHAAIHQRLLQEDLGIEPSPEVGELSRRLRSESVVPALAREERPAKPRTGSPAGTAATEEKRAHPESGRALASSLQPPDLGRLRARTAAAVAALALIGLASVLAVGRLLPSADPPLDAPGPAASRQAIAVLPFVNLSLDPEEEYLSDGLTEELISSLSKIASLRVVARTSTFAFKGDHRDIREIGRTLNVGTVLEGSIRSDRGRVRVTAQLISASDGFHLWSNTYDREVSGITDLFAVWSDLALQIASALEAELTPAERVRLAHRPTADPEAYALYLKGRHFWNQRTSGGYARAIGHFERAIEADPEYAAAHAGLAMSYSLQGLSGDLTPQEARERMRGAALKAVVLDEGSAEAHAALAAYLNLYEWDSEASERAYVRAIELDPSYGTVRHLYANLLRAMKRLDEAIAQRRLAVELDPLAPQLGTSLGDAFLAAGRADEALAQYRNVLELDSTFWAVHASLGELHASEGRFSEAIRAYRRAVELSGARASVRAGLTAVLARSGREDEARRMLAGLQAEVRRTGIYGPAEAAVFLALNDVDGAFAWLERAYRQRHPGLRLALWRGDFARLEGDPRLVDLLGRLGLPP